MTTLSSLNPNLSHQTGVGDKVGIVASGLCAIHCLLTPVLLIFVNDFAGIWTHPAAHWGLAAITIPLATRVIVKASKRHGKSWVAYCAGLGALAIIGSLLAPMLVEPAAAATTCENGCCPSIQHSDSGGLELNFPLASILSMTGGVLLIAGHLGNLIYNRCHIDNNAECGCS